MGERFYVQRDRATGEVPVRALVHGDPDCLPIRVARACGNGIYEIDAAVAEALAEQGHEICPVCVEIGEDGI